MCQTAFTTTQNIRLPVGWRGHYSAENLIQPTVGCLINVMLELHAYFRVPFHFDWSSTPVQSPLCSVSVLICHVSRGLIISQREFSIKPQMSAKGVTVEINSVPSSLHATVDANISTPSLRTAGFMHWTNLSSADLPDDIKLMALKCQDSNKN